MGVASIERVFAFLALLMTTTALIMDQEATSDIISAATSARDGGEVALVFRGPQGSDATREELIHAKASDDTAIWLYYNKKSNKATLESLHGGFIKSVSWGLEEFPSGSLVLVATSKRVKLLVGCKELHWHGLSGKYDLLDILSRQKLKLYHEENASVQVYRSEKAALDFLGCNQQGDAIIPPSLLNVDQEDHTDSDAIEVRDFIRNEDRRKREEEMQGDQYRDNFIGNDPRTSTAPPRGDIPSSAIETCDDEVIKQLQLLRQTIELLRREVSDQKSTIDDLRKRLSQCCNRPQPPPVERCTGSTCYPGYY